MEYFGKIQCISHHDLTCGPNPIMSVSNYRKLQRLGKINVVRSGKGLGRYALVEVATLPQRFQEKVIEKYGDMNSEILRIWIGSHYSVDAEARQYYSHYRLDNGEGLPVSHIDEYTVNASAIKAVLRLMADTDTMRKAMKAGPVNWNELAGAISYYREEFGHTLPASANRFKKKVNDFKAGGYGSLVSRKFQNQNRRKVTWRIDGLIRGLKAQTEHPYDTVVAEMYNQFVLGELDVYDPATGELFDPADFRDKNGNPLVLSKSTIAQYLNKPITSIAVARAHQDQWSFNNSQRPYHLRYKGMYAGSQISLDDRDLPHKMPDGSTVKSYLAFDVTSEAVVGYAYSRRKDALLFIECMRNMFRTLNDNGLKLPAELQVEHHIVRDFSDGLMKAGTIFPLIHWCAPGNSRDKHAEHFHRAKKYGVEKRSQQNIGRWFARLDEHRTKVKKVYDEENNTYKERTYSYEQLVADDISAIKEYNSAPHPNQKKFPGLSRWDVYVLFQNPGLKEWPVAELHKYIGEHVATTIRQNAYLTVQYNQYRLSSPEVIGRLSPRNYRVDAYYLAGADGEIGEVYVYQDGRYIDTCKKVARYNTATVEQTDADRAAYRDQAGYVAMFDSMVRKNRISRVGVLRKDVSATVAAAAASAVAAGETPPAATDTDYSEYMDAERWAAEGAAKV